MRIMGIIAGILRETGGAWRCTEDWRSTLRLTFDILYSRLLRFGMPNWGGLRQVRLKSGLIVTYRLNRGDLQALREVIFQECYRPALPPASGTFVDLGANIGLASLWFWKRFGFSKVIAVEPDAENLEVLRENFRLNGVQGEIVSGVVGASGKTALFAPSSDSVLGHVSAKGIPVDVIDLDRLLRHEQVGLMKIDIEGAEQNLVSGSLQWLENVDAIIAELHPTLVDCSFVVDRIVGAGFDYVPANSLEWPNADFFHAAIKKPSSERLCGLNR